VGDKHPKRKILIWDQQMFREHEIDDEFENVDFNVFQKTISEVEQTPVCGYILLISSGGYRTRSSQGFEQ